MLHFAIVAIQRATRKTSLKGHTRRVIRLYVTRPSPSRIQLNVMEMSGTFVRGNSVCVPAGWSFSPKLAQEELLLVLFRSVTEYRCTENMRLTALCAFCHIEKTSSHIILTVKDHVIAASSPSFPFSYTCSTLTRLMLRYII